MRIRISPSRAAFLSVVAVASLVLPAIVLAQTDTAGVAQQIRDLEQKINATYAANDLPTYFKYYAPDLTQWFEQGRVDLPQYEKMWTDYIGAGNRIVTADVRDLNIRVSPDGDAAAASYLLHLKVHSKDGKESEEDNHETDVFFKRSGVWKIVVLHYSPAPAKKRS